MEVTSQIGRRVGPRLGMENFLTSENFLPLPRFEPRADNPV